VFQLAQRERGSPKPAARLVWRI